MAEPSQQSRKSHKPLEFYLSKPKSLYNGTEWLLKKTLVTANMEGKEKGRSLSVP